MATKTAEECLAEIWTLSVETRSKPLKIIQKIFTNLIGNPDEEKFKDLNFDKLALKFHASSAFLELLVIAGFVLSADETRLYFDDAQFSDLLDTNKLLQSKLNSTTQSTDTADTTRHEEKKQDVEHESNAAEEEKKYPNDDDDGRIASVANKHSSQSKDTVLTYLMNMGYAEQEVLDALAASNNNVDVALDLLLNGTMLEHKYVDTADETRTHLKHLFAVAEEHRLPGIKSFYDIVNRLLNNLEDEKYHSLNYQGVCKKFADCPPCIDLLQDAGFRKSEDGTRLVFNSLYMKNISNVMHQMSEML